MSKDKNHHQPWEYKIFQLNLCVYLEVKKKALNLKTGDKMFDKDIKVQFRVTFNKKSITKPGGSRPTLMEPHHQVQSALSEKIPLIFLLILSFKTLLDL